MGYLERKETSQTPLICERQCSVRYSRGTSLVGAPRRQLTKGWQCSLLLVLRQPDSRLMTVFHQRFQLCPLQLRRRHMMKRTNPQPHPYWNTTKDEK